ncbi:MAG: 3-phosphoshikimate 1-carboxyvinyltransferase [Bacteroidaceae bacterium]|nr:3-phosphoshikimate 1-carboxyvinyltransferase [Bacteroidaceae bacterium]
MVLRSPVRVSFNNSTINTTITLPASKSISNRVLIVSALCGSHNPAEHVRNLATCDDTTVLLQAFSQRLPYEINIGAAGTSMRFLTAFLAARCNDEHIITGSQRMKNRPIAILVDALRSLGADVEYVEREGYPPLKICGKSLKGGHLSIPGSVSSQYISAILMIAPLLQDGLTLKLTGEIISRPYINLTLDIMRHFGAKAEWTAQDTITIQYSPYSSTSFIVENDWSAASYWYEILAIKTATGADKHNRITLKGLYPNSSQGDSAIAKLFDKLGIDTRFTEEGVSISTKQEFTNIHRLEYDFTDIPDMAQTFAVTCCAMNIPFHFTGLQSLRIKETDRIDALCNELRKVGYVLESRNDRELLWNGNTCTPTFEPIDTYDDHRMAMSFAPLAIKFGHIDINNPEVVSKSYTNYWSDIQKII